MKRNYLRTFWVNDSQSSISPIISDLVYYTKQVPDTSDASATRTTRVRHEWDTSNKSVTRVLHERHECNTSATRVRHECYTNDTSMTRVKNFDFDKDTSENIFSQTYISYIANQKHFIPRTTFWKWLVPIPKCFWSAPQNLHFAMAIAISKSYTLDCSYNCPCTFSHSYA